MVADNNPQAKGKQIWNGDIVEQESSSSDATESEVDQNG